MRDILRNPLLSLIIILAIGFAAYSFMIQPSFKTLDDHISIIENDNIKSFDHFGKIFTTSYFGDKAYYRPLVYVTYAFEYHFFNLNASYYYFNNILLHLISAMLIYWMMLLISRKPIFAFFVSLLFAIHPIHWEAVSNISGRAILLSTVFSVASFVFFLKSCNRKGAIVYYGLSLVSFILALLSKESAGILPLIFISYILLIKKEGLISSVKAVVPFFIVCFIYIYWRHALGIVEVFYWRNPAEAFFGFVTFLRSVITHLRLLMVPSDFYFDRSQQLIVGFSNPRLWGVIILYVAALIVLVTSRRKFSHESKFFFFWFCIHLIPISQFLVSIGTQPGVISAADHFLYAASIGFFGLMVSFFLWLHHLNLQKQYVSLKVFRFGVVGWLVFLFLITVNQNIYSSNEITMFQQTVQRNPGNARVRNSLALAYAYQGYFKEAEGHFRKVLEHHPANIRARVSYAKSISDQGRHFEAITEYERIQEPGKYESLIQGNLQATYDALIEQYKAIIENEPENAAAYYSLGVVYSKLKKRDEALALYKQAVALDPGNSHAVFNLASTLFVQGDLQTSRELFEKFLGSDAQEELKIHARKYLMQINKTMGRISNEKVY